MNAELNKLQVFNNDEPVIINTKAGITSSSTHVNSKFLIKSKITTGSVKPTMPRETNNVYIDGNTNIRKTTMDITHIILMVADNNCV